MTTTTTHRPCGCPGDGDPHLSDCPIRTGEDSRSTADWFAILERRDAAGWDDQ